LLFKKLPPLSKTELILTRISSTPEEFKSGYLEDAINIEWQDIKNLNKEIKKDDKIYLYCRSGNRSGKATDILINLGYKNVKNIGGLKEASESLNLRIIK